MSLQPFLTVADLEREGVATGFFDLAARRSEVAGAIDFATDEDYFLFSPFPDTRYRLSVDANFDAMLGLYDIPGLDRLERDDDGGPARNPEIVLDAGSVPQAFLIEVDAFDNGEPGDAIFAGGGDYRLVVEDLGQNGVPPGLGEDVTGGVPATGGSLAPGEPVLDFMDFAGDLDSFSIYVEAGHSYRADLNGAPLQGGPIADPFLELVEQDGTLIDFDDDSGPGLNASLAFTARETGFLSLVVSDLRGDRGSYDLTYYETAGPALTGPDRVGDAIATSALIEAHEPVVERIESPADADVYEVALQNGNLYTADVIGFGGFDPTLRLRDFDGTTLAFNDDVRGRLDSRIEFRAPQTDFFYLEVEGFGASTGNYDLLVEPSDVVPATTLEAHTVALLYEASFGRQAAYAGLNFWIDQLEDGRPMERIAQDFIDSREFTAVSGNDPDRLNDGAFIDQLSLNVLDRFLRPDGFDFWVDELDVKSRAEVLIDFAIAPENAAQSPNVDTIWQIGQGDGPLDDPGDALRPDAPPEWDFFAA